MWAAETDAGSTGWMSRIHERRIQHDAGSLSCQRTGFKGSRFLKMPGDSSSPSSIALCNHRSCHILGCIARFQHWLPVQEARVLLKVRVLPGSCPEQVPQLRHRQQAIFIHICTREELLCMRESPFLRRQHSSAFCNAPVGCLLWSPMAIALLPHTSRPLLTQTAAGWMLPFSNAIMHRVLHHRKHHGRSEPEGMQQDAMYWLMCMQWCSAT